jgi:hypothetical protein
MRSRRRRKSKSVRIKHKICRDPRSLTIDQFCSLHGFARSTYYPIESTRPGATGDADRPGYPDYGRGKPGLGAYNGYGSGRTSIGIRSEVSRK